MKYFVAFCFVLGACGVAFYQPVSQGNGGASAGQLVASVSPAGEGGSADPCGYGGSDCE